MSEDFTRSLFKTLAILRPYLPQIAIGGGWVPFLYYRYLAKNRGRTPVFTSDIDLMVRHQVSIVGPRTIDEILTVEAKLTTVFKNLDNPAVIHYQGAIGDVEVEIEFLTDQNLHTEKAPRAILPTLHPILSAQTNFRFRPLNMFHFFVR